MSKILPVNKNEFFEIRIHSIGGQGAYTTGQMVASMGATMPEIQSAIFATYGSEKKGAPVNVFVRFLESESKITNYSAVLSPNVVVVFHEQLLKTINVLDGLREGGKVVINSSLSAQELADTYGLNVNNITVVDATKISVEVGAKINTVMFGALLKELPFLEFELARKQIEDKLSYKYPQLVPSNIEACQRGYDEAIEDVVIPNENTLKTFKSTQIGYNAQYAGGVIKGPNTQFVDRSISREGYIPSFNQELCINCTKCDQTCPDDCFVWEEVEGRRGRMEMVLTGIDYQFCKGCLRCVEACPTEALASIVEQRGYASENTAKKIFDFVKGV